MKQGETYTRDPRDFLAKLKATGEVPKRAILGQQMLYGLIPASHIVKVWISLKTL